MVSLLVSVVVGSISYYLHLRYIRHRHHEALLREYCKGFCDGVAYETKVQVEHGKRAVVRAGMSVN